MTDLHDNITTNKNHYDHVYSKIHVDEVVRKVDNLDAFLSDAIRTDTSWHGLYHGNFRETIAGKRVFEIGCGDGTNALIMAAIGAEVVANDISHMSSEIIIAAADRLGLSNISTVVGDFSTISFDMHSFDFVVGKAFLHHLTHELEEQYVRKICTILKQNGEARFFEPAVNSHFLDQIRWMIPVGSRPSILNRARFAEWKAKDPHPERNNSTTHFVALGRQFFHDVEAVYIGSIERLHRLLPSGTFNRSFRRWAHAAEEHLPNSFRRVAARSQLLVYRNPRRLDTPSCVNLGESI
jgi:SAM-dependent methyltransferase